MQIPPTAVHGTQPPQVAQGASAGFVANDPPPTLLDCHREHLRESTLSDKTIAAAGIYSVQDPTQAGSLLCWSRPAPVPSIAFPVFDRAGKVVQTILRPDAPRRNENDKPIKYESPLGRATRLYFPPDDLVSPELWMNLSQPLLVVEGIKKALAAAQVGTTAVSAQGVWLWHDTEHKRQTGQWQLHPDLVGVPLKERDVFIAFDGGDTTSNVSVILAEAQLARMLLDAGARVRLLRIPAPDGRKVGLDDHLHMASSSGGKQALEALIGCAIDADPLAQAGELETSKNRETDGLRLIKDQSFIAALSVADMAVQDVVRAKLLRKAHITRPSVEQSISSLRSQLRNSSPAAGATHSENDRELPAPDILDDAEKLLRDPNLLDRFSNDIAADGLVGEQEAAATILLVCISRAVPKNNGLQGDGSATSQNTGFRFTRARANCHPRPLIGTSTPLRTSPWPLVAGGSMRSMLTPLRNGSQSSPPITPAPPSTDGIVF